MVQFGTLDYYKKVAEAMNTSEEMKNAGMTMNMIYEVSDVLMPNGSPSRHFLKFDKGQVVEVREAKPGEDVDVSYIAKKEIYQRMFTGSLKGEDAMKTGWLKCNYKLGKMIKWQKALGVFMKVIATVPAEY
jgi:putative sterol carrier protein